MSEDKIYKNLVSKMEEISTISPQTMGPLTGYYKRFIPFLKTNPWRVFVVAAVVISFFFYFLFGPSIVRLASLFQNGF